ncbi:MAG: hypothetical protein Q9181_002082 [Wetmoreana brouardii]
MSGVRAFVGNRGRSSNEDGSSRDHEQDDRIRAKLSQLGIDRSLTGTQERASHDKPADRSSSRQAIADRSRVATPTFNAHRNFPGIRHEAERSKTQRHGMPSIQPISNSQVPLQAFSNANSKSVGVFDTDTEGLGDTTGFSGLTDPMAHPSKLQIARSEDGHPEDKPRDFRTLQASRQVGVHSKDPAMSPGSSHFAETGIEHDGDDEFDELSQYDELTMNQGGPLESYYPAGVAVPRDRTRHMEETAPNQASDRPQIPIGSGPLVSPGDLAHDAHTLSSTRTSSESLDDAKSRMERDGFPEAHDVDQRSILMDHGVGKPGVPETRADHFRPQSTGFNKATTTAKRKHDQGKTQVDLDYDLKTLTSMSFQQLASESFDTSPQPIELKDPALTDKSSLEGKLVYLHSLDGPRDQVQLQRQAFFSSLPIDQYEECGGIMTDCFSQVISKFKQARQEKRALAKEFESEIASREKNVERRKVAVTEDLDRLKRAGQDVVRGK